MRPKLALPLLPPKEVEPLFSPAGKREFSHSHHSFPSTINDFILRATFENRQDQVPLNHPSDIVVSISGFNRYESVYHINHPAAAFIGSSRDG